VVKWATRYINFSKVPWGEKVLHRKGGRKLRDCLERTELARLGQLKTSIHRRNEGRGSQGQLRGKGVYLWTGENRRSRPEGRENYQSANR